MIEERKKKHFSGQSQNVFRKYLRFLFCYRFWDVFFNDYSR